MKKIGIITLSASYNCGSMLQSYALKEILKRYGDVEIINFSSAASHKMYDIVPGTFLKKLRMKYHNKTLFNELLNEDKAYTDFQRNMLEISGKEFWAEDLQEIADKYDIVVAGSDQVWNVCMGDFDEAFFCGWTNGKKVAYAPSLGGHDIRESANAEKIIAWINDFDALSVRESVGKNCLDDITGKDVEKVLDPTLVYGEDKWRALVGKPIVEGEYIFYYSWAYCYEELKRIVSERAHELQMPTYVIDAHKWRTHQADKDGFILCREAGPMAFLNLMYYAKECYVESFHGMLFAYMFQKNFWLLDTHENYEQLDARLRELVELVNARDRILTKYNNIYIDKNLKVEYSDNSMLRNMCQTSEQYLQEVFSEI